MVVKNVSRDCLGREAQLVECFLAIVFYQLTECDPADLVLNTVGLEVAALHPVPRVIFLWKVSCRANRNGGLR